MSYVICPSCGHLLADIEIEFTDKYNKIVENKELDEKKKEKEIEKLFEEFKVKKYCCRMRLISYFDPAKVII
jgi:DNA-directed RNA polymerase subunit N (RpoN/RPB10)